MNNKQIDAEIKRIRAQTRKKKAEIKNRDNDYYRAQGYTRAPAQRRKKQLKAYDTRQNNRIKKLQAVKAKNTSFNNAKKKEKFTSVPRNNSEFVQNIITYGVLEYQLSDYADYKKVMRQAQEFLQPADVYSLQISALVDRDGNFEKRSMRINEAVYPVMLTLSKSEFNAILDDANNNIFHRDEALSNSDDEIKDSPYRLPGIMISFRSQDIQRPAKRKGNPSLTRNRSNANFDFPVNDEDELSLFTMEI